MNTCPNLNNDPGLLKMKAKDNETEAFLHKTEEHDHKNFLKSLKIDNEY